MLEDYQFVVRIGRQVGFSSDAFHMCWGALKRKKMKSSIIPGRGNRAARRRGKFVGHRPNSPERVC